MPKTLTKLLLLVLFVLGIGLTNCGNGIIVSEKNVFSLAKNDILKDSIVFNGNKLAFIMNSEGKKLLFVNGSPIVEERNVIVGSVVFDKSGINIAYSVQREGGFNVVTNANIGMNLEKVGRVVFSVDGKHYIYSGRKDGYSILVVDNVIKWKGYGIGVYGFNSSDEYYCVGYKAPRKCQLVLGGKLLDIKGNVLAEFPKFSDDSNSYACGYKVPNGYRLLVNGKTENRVYEAIYQFIFSRNGKDYACLVKTEGKQGIEINGNKPRLFDGVISGTTIFANNGDLYYAAIEGGKQSYYKNGNKYGGSYDGLSPIIVNDSLKNAYVGIRNRKMYVVIDGLESGEYEEVLQNSLHFNPKTNKIAYGVKKDGRVLIVSEYNIVDQYDALQYCTFSPNGNHFIYAVKLNGKGLMFCDKERLIGRYDELMGNEPIVFDNDTGFHYWAIKNKYIERVEVKFDN